MTLTPATFQPGLSIHDALADHWLRQVTVRLRREIAWLWHERSGEVNASGQLPPFSDPLLHVLDQTRFAQRRTQFFQDDETAAYLSDLLQEPEPAPPSQPPRGSFSWVAKTLDLKPLDRFVLALALCPVVDSSAETVLAACQNNPSGHVPTLALAQKLWDQPEELLQFSSITHPLFQYGLIQPAPAGEGVTHAMPLRTAPEVAHTLLARSPSLPSFLSPIPTPSDTATAALELAASRLRASPPDHAAIVPIIGGRDQSLGSVAVQIAHLAQRKVVSAQGLPGKLASSDDFLCRLTTLAWLHGVDLYLRFNAPASSNGSASLAPHPSLPLPDVPIALFVGLESRQEAEQLPRAHRHPATLAPSESYHDRLAHWQAHLKASSHPTIAQALPECARRFRYPAAKIASISRGLNALQLEPTENDLFEACRADLDLGELAQPVTPRFQRQDLMLPPKQDAQFEEILTALGALGTVHYEWGTAQVWNEGGLSALFAGPPGTGKTMAAEVVAAASRLPLFRIDLSQVVNKYIGETEKNLRRLFDAAEASDVILFFDEADSLFGKRTEVKDAHDRYANLEVSYLLERMERFKGLAILATNRKKDLDEAFLRRLRFFIDFPLPGENERRRIWQNAVPEDVDTSDLDFDFLASRFPLAGGHIRSIVFNACLQTARPGQPKSLSMEKVIMSVKREYDKLDRSLSLEQFGPHAPIIQKMS